MPTWVEWVGALIPAGIAIWSVFLLGIALSYDRAMRQIYRELNLLQDKLVALGLIKRRRFSSFSWVLVGIAVLFMARFLAHAGKAGWFQ